MKSNQSSNQTETKKTSEHYEEKYYDIESI